jgi:hypothetical protein
MASEIQRARLVREWTQTPGRRPQWLAERICRKDGSAGLLRAGGTRLRAERYPMLFDNLKGILVEPADAESTVPSLRIGNAISAEFRCLNDR